MLVSHLNLPSIICPMNRCWDTKTMMTSSIKLYPHPCFVYAAQYHPGSPHLVVTGGYDHLIRVWTKLSDGLNGKVKWLHWQTVHVRDVDNNLRRVTLKTPPSCWLIYTVLLVLIEWDKKYQDIDIDTTETPSPTQWYGSCPLIIGVSLVLKRTFTELKNSSSLDYDNDFPSVYWNVIHCHLQKSFPIYAYLEDQVTLALKKM